MSEEKIFAPQPCKRAGGKEASEWTIKDHFQKINEELDELKNEINGWCWDLATFARTEKNDAKWKKSIAEEAADTITAITTMLEALGIDEKMRNEAQRQINERNRERGRL